MKEGMSYWPIGIALMVATVVVLIVFTIDFAVTNPVEQENKYMMTYRGVDDNINELIKSQKRFEEKFKITKESEKFDIGTNNFVFKIESLDGAPLEGLSARCLLSRPHTTKEDALIENALLIDNTFTCQGIEIKNKGRYEVGIIVQTSEFGAYYNFEINSTI